MKSPSKENHSSFSNSRSFNSQSVVVCNPDTQGNDGDFPVNEVSKDQGLNLISDSKDALNDKEEKLLNLTPQFHNQIVGVRMGPPLSPKMYF
jgi:hypothetical protein